MTTPRTRTSRPTPARADFTSFSARVVAVTRHGKNFVRVTLTGAELAQFHAAGFDQRVKLIFPLGGTGVSSFPRNGADWYSSWRELPEHERCPMRTYTVRAYREQSREIDIDFVVHGDSGPATRWVNRARAGDELLLVGPDARTLVEGDGPVGGVEFRPGAAGRFLIAGDETAAPAICSILESLPADARGQAFIEVACDDDILPISAPQNLSVTWIARDSRPGLEHGEAVSRAARAWTSEMVTSVAAVPGTSNTAAPFADVDVDREMLWDVPAADDQDDHDLYAWIAGEAGFVKELRRFLVRDAGMDRDDVAFMGYWRTGKAEN